MASQSRIGTHATKVATSDNVTRVTYHSTVVVAWDQCSRRVTLDSGGRRTPTTQARMNQTANQFGLRFRVFQTAYEWFVTFNGAVEPFVDGMTFRVA